MFSGTIITEWLDNGRDMRIVKEVKYIDPYGIEWIAPVDAIINGASIPQPLWSAVGSPFVGKYRRASVFHDVACTEQTRPSMQVHKMFYNAMIEDGVEPEKAESFYSIVVLFGPRWGDTDWDQFNLYPFDLSGDIE